MRATTLIALALLVLLPGLAAAVVTCSANDDGLGQITVTVSSSNTFTGFDPITLVNASQVAQNCVPLGPNPCQWTVVQIAPGPASAETTVTDADGPVLCGPFDNTDGLPVELVEFSVG